MSDYLRNLVARTLAPTGSVRPQLLSVFEPPPAHPEFKVPLDFTRDAPTDSSVVVPGDATSLTLAHVDRERAHEASHTMAQLSSPNKISAAGVEPDAVQPRYISPQFAPTPQVANELLRSHHDRGVEAVHPYPPRRSNDVGTVELTGEEPASPLPLPLATSSRPRSTARVAGVAPGAHVYGGVESRPPRRGSGVGAAEINEEGLSLRPSKPTKSLELTTLATPVRSFPPVDRTATSSADAPGETSASAAARLPVTESAVAAEASRYESTQSLTVQPVMPVARILPPLVPLTAATEPPPTIHVTIGRVEVRATPPPAARQRPAAAATPRLTLEEYLQRRASGERR